jgi:putative YpdA family bacillithiol system oxidoreductase
METFLTFLIAGCVTLFFVRGYLKRLAGPKTAPSSNAPVAKRDCPRCSRSIEKGIAFCPYCGAALAMWSVHTTKAQAPSTGAPQGKPQPVINASLCIGCASCVHACPEAGTLEMHAGKAILAHPELCTGHAKCVDVCPTQALALSFGGILQTMRVPMVKENFETNIPGVFIVGELCGMGLIKTAVNEGKLVIDHLRSRVQPGQSGDSYDVAIIGAGPAGLSASLAALQQGMRYLTLEQGEIASTIRQYPRQKFLMAEPLEIPLYGNLYVGDGTKEALLAVWETIISNTGVRINTNERVQTVQKNGTGFYIETGKAKYHARNVVLAMGKRGAPRKLGVPGEDLPKVAYRLIEAESYENKDILVVGGGDSAIEAALAVSRSGKNRVTLSYRGDSFVRARERNREFIAQARNSGALRVELNSNVMKIDTQQVILESSGKAIVLPNDYVFIAIGGESPEDFLRKTGIEIVEKAIGAQPAFV